MGVVLACLMVMGFACRVVVVFSCTKAKTPPEVVDQHKIVKTNLVIYYLFS